MLKSHRRSIKSLHVHVGLMTAALVLSCGSASAPDPCPVTESDSASIMISAKANNTYARTIDICCYANGSSRFDVFCANGDELRFVNTTSQFSVIKGGGMSDNTKMNCSPHDVYKCITIQLHSNVSRDSEQLDVMCCIPSTPTNHSECQDEQFEFARILERGDTPNTTQNDDGENETENTSTSTSSGANKLIPEYVQVYIVTFGLLSIVVSHNII